MKHTTNLTHIDFRRKVGSAKDGSGIRPDQI